MLAIETGSGSTALAGQVARRHQNEHALSSLET